MPASSSLMPLVMKRSIAPSASTMPMAAYWALDEVAHTVGDELQHPVEVEHAADAADRLVERGELGGRALRPVARAWAAEEPELERARQRCGLLGVAADPHRADGLAATRARGARSRRRLVGPEVEVEVRQGRSVNPNPSHCQSHEVARPGPVHSPERGLALVRRVGLPGVDRLEQWRQYEQAGTSRCHWSARLAPPGGRVSHRARPTCHSARHLGPIGCGPIWSGAR